MEVAIQVNGEFLDFTVKDNGVGIESIEEVLAPVTGKHGVALSNINRRLKQAYGRGLEIHSAKGEGTVVHWVVPMDGRRRKR